MEKLSNGTHIFNVANPQPVSTKELSEKISLALGRTGQINSIPESLIRNLIRTADALLPSVMRKQLSVNMDQVDKLTTTTTYSIEKLVQATGFQPQYDLLTTLKSEINWAKSNGMLN